MYLLTVGGKKEMAKERKRQPRTCKKCGAGTTFRGVARDRKKAQLCKECFDVSVADPERLLSCLECKTGKILKRRETYCKPCRRTLVPEPTITTSYTSRRWGWKDGALRQGC